MQHILMYRGSGFYVDYDLRTQRLVLVSMLAEVTHVAYGLKRGPRKDPAVAQQVRESGPWRIVSKKGRKTTLMATNKDDAVATLIKLGVRQAVNYRRSVDALRRKKASTQAART